jgi:hypothetical protein
MNVQQLPISRSWAPWRAPQVRVVRLQSSTAHSASTIAFGITAAALQRERPVQGHGSSMCTRSPQRARSSCSRPLTTLSACCWRCTRACRRQGACSRRSSATQSWCSCVLRLRRCVQRWTQCLRTRCLRRAPAAGCAPWEKFCTAASSRLAPPLMTTCPLCMTTCAAAHAQALHCRSQRLADAPRVRGAAADAVLAGARPEERGHQGRPGGNVCAAAALQLPLMPAPPAAAGLSGRLLQARGGADARQSPRVLRRASSEPAVAPGRPRPRRPPQVRPADSALQLPTHMTVRASVMMILPLCQQQSACSAAYKRPTTRNHIRSCRARLHRAAASQHHCTASLSASQRHCAVVPAARWRAAASLRAQALL